MRQRLRSSRWTGISAFVITLATLSIFKGINLGITKAQPFYGVPESVKAFGNTTFLGPLPWLVLPTRRRRRRSSGTCSTGCRSAATSWRSAATRMRPSCPASRYRGPSSRPTPSPGLLAALAGIMLVARLQIGQPTIGDDWLILSFAAPVIGGAVLAGGHVSVAGTVLGVVIVAIITQALVLFQIDPFLVQVVLGVLILWAVGINRCARSALDRVAEEGLSMAEAVFEARGVNKIFPGVKALRGRVDLTLEPRLDPCAARRERRRQVDADQDHHRRPPAGRGRAAARRQAGRASPARARRSRAGIGVVHQERNLIPRFSVGREHHAGAARRPGLARPIDYAAVHREARRWLDMLGLDLDPRTPVSQLSVAKMQLVEIAKALSLRSRVLLLDEPTASLTPHETGDAVRPPAQAARRGRQRSLFVSHKLEEVQEICDRVTVLRDGRNACESRPMAGLGRQDLVRLMIGRERADPGLGGSATGRPAPAVLELRGVATRPRPSRRRPDRAPGRDRRPLRPGRRRAHRAREGDHGLVPRHRRRGRDRRASRPRSPASPTRIHRHGIGYVSEDRKQEGLILMHSVLENAGITVWRRLRGRLGLLTDRAIREPRSSRSSASSRCARPRSSQLVGNLSGGNQQKISVAKWLAAGVKILIVDEPSVGIDIKTKAYLHELLRELAADGHRDPPDHQRHAGDDHPRRPHRGDGRLPGRRARSPTTATMTG